MVMIMNFFFPTISTVFALFHSSAGFASNVTDEYCKEATRSDPNLRYDFCVGFFDSNPNITRNSTLEDMVFISMELTAKNATNIRSIISKLLKKKKFPRGALKDCLELYSDANSSMEDAMSDLKHKDYAKANIDASAAMDSSTTCEDGFKEIEDGGGGGGGVSPLTKENDTFFQLTAIILAFVKMLAAS